MDFERDFVGCGGEDILRGGGMFEMGLEGEDGGEECEGEEGGEEGGVEGHCW